MSFLGFHICMDEVRMVAPFAAPILLVLVTLRARLAESARTLLSRLRR